MVFDSGTIVIARLGDYDSGAGNYTLGWVGTTQKRSTVYRAWRRNWRNREWGSHVWVGTAQNEASLVVRSPITVDAGGRYEIGFASGGVDELNNARSDTFIPNLAGSRRVSTIYTVPAAPVADTTAPTLSIEIAGINHDSVTVFVTSDEAGKGTIDAGDGVAGAYTWQRANQRHARTVRGLNASTQYTITAVCTDAAGNRGTAIKTFTTPAAPTRSAPAPVIDTLVASLSRRDTSGSVFRITWTTTNATKASITSRGSNRYGNGRAVSVDGAADLVYSRAGTYSVSLLATNADGVSVSRSIDVIVELVAGTDRTPPVLDVVGIWLNGNIELYSVVNELCSLEILSGGRTLDEVPSLASGVVHKYVHRAPALAESYEVPFAVNAYDSARNHTVKTLSVVVPDKQVAVVDDRPDTDGVILADDVHVYQVWF